MQLLLRKSYHGYQVVHTYNAPHESSFPSVGLRRIPRAVLFKRFVVFALHAKRHNVLQKNSILLSKLISPETSKVKFFNKVKTLQSIEHVIFN